jgi:predicted nucleic acid-binding protein
MTVVSNTSPLSNLAIIVRLDIVREQLGTLIIPPGVHGELSRIPNSAARQALDGAIKQGWISIQPLARSVPADLALELDAGEAEALSLALETNASLVLLDESAARLKARQLGLAHTGVLGILRQARASGRISSLKAEFGRPRTEARFFISPALEKALLISVGES